MLIIICGEDIISSRNYFQNLRQEFKKKNYDVSYLQFNHLLELNKWQSSNLSLFFNKKAFFCENLNRKLNRRNTQQIKLLETLIKNKNIEIIVWEEGIPSRQLKFGKLAIIKEFKPSQTIFKLIDNCYPGNLKTFINSLNNLPDKIEEGFIFYMLTKHIRNILLVKSNQKLSKMFDWQIWKLQKQAKFWSLEKLIAFYEGLHRIDILTKTSTNPFSLRHSLDILSYYLL